MTHDTSKLSADEWRSTIPPAEACTEIGEDYDDSVPEGGAIALCFLLSLFLVLIIVFAFAAVL